MTTSTSPDPATLISSKLPPAQLPGFTRVFADDFLYDVPLGSFPGAVANTWWAYPEGWPDTTKRGTYSPSRVISVHNGMMDLYLHEDNGTPLVAAPVPKLPNSSSSYGQLYGMYAVRFKADPVPGYKTAWLLWPDSETWPQDGEIDFPEGDLTGNMCGFVHYQGAVTGSDQAAFCPATSYSTWHTAVIEWTAGRVVLALDGHVIGSVASRVPDTPMHFVLQTETATDGTVPTASASGHVYIDWVAVYRPA